jgi:glycosyltransferase involved in cell wall biosynthesis
MEDFGSDTWRAYHQPIGEGGFIQAEARLRRDRHVIGRTSRVAIFCGDLSGAGGAERLAFEEAHALRGMGHEVRILAFRFGADATFSGRYSEDVELIDVGSGRGAAQFLAASRGLLRVLRRWRPQLVIAMSPNECARLLAPALLTGTPYITHINGTQFWFPPAQDLTKYAWSYRNVLRRVLDVSPGHAEFIPRSVRGIGPRKRIHIELSVLLHRAAVRHARQRIALSRRMAWEIELMYRRPAVSLKGAFPEAMLNYTPHGDPTAAYRIGGGPIVLNVNRLEPRKRVALTIDAFEVLLRRIPNAALVIGGVGPSEKMLHSVVAERGLGDRVHFLGFVEEDALWDWLAAADVFVHPNWAEFAIAPYEALALGTNVVWSTEMEIDPELARYPHIFPSQPEPTAMARQIAAALAAPRATPEQRQVLGVFSWERYFAKLERIISSEINRDPESPLGQ